MRPAWARTYGVEVALWENWTGLIVSNSNQMSRTPVINQALSNVWLQEQGLLSVKDLWCKAQGYMVMKRKTLSSEPTC
ncbi:hypothetical protein Cenrod_0943 [Candidatus Symbiobacter mobilis CR]|uniref:Uncharacterized protein n=1 Tax=Candidatus Symbiobacter mobilis CR TaxID=946483 RepID=U5N6X9_9BURK|nr:hypothetical protein Cenrod_0943 [Candidatus Symbiobacter mobilis CR]